MEPSELDPILENIPNAYGTPGFSPQVRAVEKALELPFTELPKMIHKKGSLLRMIVRWRLKKGV